MATEDISVLLPVFITEFSLILMINAITIIAFARIRHLRKRSTYLIINLTVADLLVGAVAGPLVVFQRFKRNQYFPWPRFITWAVKLTFIIASPMNLSLISLDRLHAILFPIRHCLITKWSYFRIIIGSWFIALLFGSLMAGLNMNISYSSFTYARTSFDVVNLLVLAVSYIVIFLNVSSLCFTNAKYKRTGKTNYKEKQKNQGKRKRKNISVWLSCASFYLIQPLVG